MASPQRAGGFSRTIISETQGIHLVPGDCTAEGMAAGFATINDPAGADVFEQGGQQVMKFVTKAAKAMGIAL